VQNISHKSLMKAQKSIETLKHRYRRAIEESGEMLENVVHGTENFASAFAFGVLQGRFADRGGIGIMGVPIELVVGLGGYVASAMGFGGQLSAHLIPIANGAIGSYASTIGRGVGTKMLQAAPARRQVASSSSPTAIRGEATLSAEELAALANPA
jgi:hypothetical protein